ncbi:MAG: transposase, partial [Planctomycetota bacterium]
HITGRVNWQVWHLEASRAYSTFLGRLREALERYSVDMLGFVVMSNHYHCVLRCPPEDRFRELTSRRTKCRHRRSWPQNHSKSSVIAQFMHWLHLTTAKAIQKELELVGHFWDGRHHRRRLWDEWALVVAIAYDHRNPVRKFMAARPELYPRSSAAWWAGNGASPLDISTRSDFPFGRDVEHFRGVLQRFQQEKRLDDVMEVFARSRLSIDSERGRALLERLVVEAGLTPLFCGSEAAPARPQVVVRQAVRVPYRG